MNVNRKYPQHLSSPVPSEQAVKSPNAGGSGEPGYRQRQRRYHWAFPEMARPQSHARSISIALRTVHLASFGILLGGHAFAVDVDRLLPALYLTIASGVGMIALEIYLVGLYWLFLGKGVMVLVKLLILVSLPYFWQHRVLLLLSVVVIASVGSHMSGRYRHYSFLHGRVLQAVEQLGFAQASEGVRGGVKEG